MLAIERLTLLYLEKGIKDRDEKIKEAKTAARTVIQKYRLNFIINIPLYLSLI